jgi:hypothetical protein
MIVLEEAKENSADLIIADPPCGSGPLLGAWLPEVHRVLRQGRFLYVFMPNIMQTQMVDVARAVGFKYMDSVPIYSEIGFLTGFLKVDKIIPPDDKAIVMSEDFDPPYFHHWNFRQLRFIEAPSEFLEGSPVKSPEMIEVIIETGCREGEIVWDIFLGTGLGVSVALSKGRRAIGIETDGETYERSAMDIRKKHGVEICETFPDLLRS